MPSFRAYLENIRVSSVVIERINHLHSLYQPIFPEEIQDIFVEQFKNKTGEYEYVSLFLFSKNYQMEIPNFMNLDQISIFRLSNQLDYLKINSSNYNFREAEQSSELTVEYSLGLVGDFEINGIGKNCDYLKNIFDHYLKPNLAK